MDTRSQLKLLRLKSEVFKTAKRFLVESPHCRGEPYPGDSTGTDKPLPLMQSSISDPLWSLTAVSWNAGRPLPGVLAFFFSIF